MRNVYVGYGPLDFDNDTIDIQALDQTQLDDLQKAINAEVEDRKLKSWEVTLLRHGEKIQAIKSVRDRLDLGLKDAKNKVDNYVAKYPEDYKVPARPW